MAISEQFERDMDQRLREQWGALDEAARVGDCPAEQVEFIAALLQAAYVAGYSYALATSDPIDPDEFEPDPPLGALWNELDTAVTEGNSPVDAVDFIATQMRAACSQGYEDALAEEEQGRRGQLCIDHGYEVPRRRSRQAADERA